MKHSDSVGKEGADVADSPERNKMRRLVVSGLDHQKSSFHKASDLEELGRDDLKCGHNMAPGQDRKSLTPNSQY